MKKNMKITYEQARKDYEFLKDYFGYDCFDAGGAFVIEESAWELLRNPSKSTARKIYIDLVRHGFHVGFGQEFRTAIVQDHLHVDAIREIYERY